MESSRFDELVDQGKEVGKVLAGLFEDVTGEEFDVEKAIRHYPIVAIGLALGTGALAGWWVGRGRRLALPPPSIEPESSVRRIGDFFARRTEGESDTPAQARDYLEKLFPGGAEKVRDVIPDVVSEEAAAMAKNWVDTVLEPKLRQGLDTMAANMSESKVGAFLRQTMQRYDQGEDHHLTEPE